MLPMTDFETYLAESQSSHSEEYDWAGSVNFSIVPSRGPYADESDLLESLNAYGVTVGDDIKEAIRQAYDSHGHQKRDSGGSYVHEHLFPVTIDVAEFYREHLKRPASSEVIVSSILHDSVEDDPRMSLERLEDLFGRDVREIVGSLTKIDWRNLPGKNEEEKRRRLEIYKVDEQLAGAPEGSKIIKGFDRVNNIRCLPIYGRSDKTERVRRNTRDIFMPWLERTQPLIYETLDDEMARLEERMEPLSLYQMPERKAA